MHKNSYDLYTYVFIYGGGVPKNDTNSTRRGFLNVEKFLISREQINCHTLFFLCFTLINFRSMQLKVYLTDLNVLLQVKYPLNFQCTLILGHIFQWFSHRLHRPIPINLRTLYVYFCIVLLFILYYKHAITYLKFIRCVLSNTNARLLFMGIVESNNLVVQVVKQLWYFIPQSVTFYEKFFRREGSEYFFSDIDIIKNMEM